LDLFTRFGKQLAPEKGSRQPLEDACSATEGSSVGILWHKFDHLVSAGRCIMKKAKIAITIICLLWTAVATVLISEAATTFAGAIVGIDQVQHTITFQTSTGQTWTMPVADSKIMEQPIAKGDRVKIDVELSDSDLSQRITKVTKIHKDDLIEERERS